MEWRQPLLRAASSAAPLAPGLEHSPVIVARLRNLTVEFYPRGAEAPDASFRKISFGRSLELMSRVHAEGRPSSPYLLLTVPPRHWRALLRGFLADEPTFVARRDRRPEEECAAALGPANRSWQFERELRWRMLALGSAGSGMHLHRDRLPLGSWHQQVFGRKRYLLCPPGPAHLYCNGAVDGFNPDHHHACPAFRARASSCIEHTLQPGDSLFYPEHWWHQTRTLDDGTLSISRSLLTPAGAARFAVTMRNYCREAMEVAPDTFRLMCEALAPCLQRLLRVPRDE